MNRCSETLLTDLILTQSACDVCAVDAKQVLSMADTILPRWNRTDVLALSPESLHDLFPILSLVGEKTGKPTHL